MMRTVAALVCLLVFACPLSAQTRPVTTPPKLPPISMTCIHHPEILETEPGTCPLCKMALVPVRLDSAFMCPVHSAVIESDRGTCRLCGRELVPVTVALTWTCRGDQVEHLEPGVCSDGSPRIGKRALRPHGNHNPRHGGQFFMAPDNWHHLEGAYPAARSFRLYLYDDYGRPLPLGDVRKAEARVVTKETFDPKTHETTEISAFPLKLSRNREYLEARVDTTSLPAEMTAKIRFEPGTPEHRFDFTFEAVTKEPVAPTRPASAPAASTPAPAAPAPAVSQAASVPGIGNTQPLPTSMTDMLSQLQASHQLVRDLIARGDFTAVWVPAFRTKDLAIALQPHFEHLPADKRALAEPALADVVRGAWLLDAAGDLGNRSQVEAAYSTFGAAVSELMSAFK